MNIVEEINNHVKGRFGAKNVNVTLACAPMWGHENTVIIFGGTKQQEAAQDWAIAVRRSGHKPVITTNSSTSLSGKPYVSTTVEY